MQILPNEWMLALFVFLAVLPFIPTSRLGFKAILIGIEHQWYLFRSNNPLHIKLVYGGTILVVPIGSISIITVMSIWYLLVWLANPFSIPLEITIFRTLLIIATPVLVAAPLLLYIKRFPPDKWMVSRIARLGN